MRVKGLKTQKQEPVTAFQHKKSLGQNFLTSSYVPNLMCDAGTVSADDTVIEIGPGTGALTKVLLERSARVIAIETDNRAIAVLTDTFAEQIATGQLTIVAADIRTTDMAHIVAPLTSYKVIANIPYYLSGFLLRTILELPKPPKTLVFLMQKEVVHRICRDQKASLLSLSVRVYGEPVYVKTISKGHFSPPPNVDSAILLVRNISHKNLKTAVEREHFFSLLHRGLGSKRKQLQGLLRNHYDEVVITNAFQTLHLKPDIRGEDMSLETWLQLHTLLLQATSSAQPKTETP